MMFPYTQKTKIVSNHKLIKFIFIYETYTEIIPERESLAVLYIAKLQFV